MSPAHLSLLALLVAIVLSCTSRINVGLLAIVLAWVIGVYAGGLKVDAVLAGFPAALFLTLVGVTLLFSLAQSNGTLERLAERAVRLCRGNVALLPVLFFVLAGALSAAGPGAIAASALVAPLAIPIATRAGIPVFLTAVMVGLGANAGNLSPISSVGVIVNTLMAKAGLPGHEWKVWASNFAAHALVAVGAYALLGGARLVGAGRSARGPAGARGAADAYRRGAPPEEHDSPAAPNSYNQMPAERSISPRDVSPRNVSPPGVADAPAPGPLPSPEPAAAARGVAFDRRHRLTMAVALLWLVAVIGFKVHVGMGAFAAAVALVLLRAADEREVVRGVPWGVILMVSGMTVLIALLEKTGGLTLFTAMLARLATPRTVNGVIAFVTGLISTYSSTSGVVLPAFLPTVPGLVRQVGGGDPLAVSLSINVGSALVDVSPLSTIGALCVAAVPSHEEGRTLFRKLLIFGLSMTLVGAALCQLLAGPFARW